MSKNIEYHKFQLLSLDVKELSIISLADNLKEKKEQPSNVEGSIKTGQSDFDEETKEIVAGIKFEINPERDKSISSFSLTVEIRGIFKLQDELEAIDHDDLGNWINVNSIYLLFPYLREQVYSLTQRAGFNPTILPLISLPGSSKKEKEMQDQN